MDGARELPRHLRWHRRVHVVAERHGRARAGLGRELQRLTRTARGQGSRRPALSTTCHDRVMSVLH